MERGMITMTWVFFLHKRLKFVGDRMSYIMLGGRWFHIIVLNVYSPTEDKIDDVKDSFYISGTGTYI
jgi:hypothetical protein